MKFLRVSSPVFPLGLAAFAAGANAIRAPIVGRSTRNAIKRSSIFGTSTLKNSGDVAYFTNITLAGVSYQVQIDTGSSDLWVSGDSKPTQGVTETGKNTTFAYAIGSADGDIMMADWEWQGYKVQQQAFAFCNDSQPLPAPGIMGLGPWMSSVITNTLSCNYNQTGVLGLPVVNELFAQNKSTPNYISVLLGRSDDPVNNSPGDLTISELLPGYEDVLNQPKLEVERAQFENFHYSVLVDEGGVIGSDGQPISVETNVSSTKNKARLTAMFDTGYSLPQVPPAIAKGFYSKVEGAKLENVTNLGIAWTLPCDKEVNVSFKIGGATYHVHPLDATIVPDKNNKLDNNICVGAFQPIAKSAQDPDIDMILGDSFLRNVYLYVNYGDYALYSNDTSPSRKANPYVQLLSTSNNTAELHAEFVKVRMNGTDVSASQGHGAAGAAEGLSSSSSKSVSSKSSFSKPKIGAPSSSNGNGHRLSKGVIIGIVVAVVVVLLLIVAFYVVKRRTSSKYQTLDAPAPGAATDTHTATHPGFVPPVSTGYNPPPPPTEYNPTEYQPPVTEYQPSSYPYQPPPVPYTPPLYHP